MTLVTFARVLVERQFVTKPTEARVTVGSQNANILARVVPARIKDI